MLVYLSSKFFLCKSLANGDGENNNVKWALLYIIWLYSRDIFVKYLSLYYIIISDLFLTVSHIQSIIKPVNIFSCLIIRPQQLTLRSNIISNPEYSEYFREFYPVLLPSVVTEQTGFLPFFLRTSFFPTS